MTVHSVFLVFLRRVFNSMLKLSIELTAGHHFGLYNSRDGVIVKACWAFAPDILNEVEDDEEYALRSLG